MLYAKIEKGGKQEANLYSLWDDFHRDTFSPDTNIVDIIEFRLKGKTYKERQASLEGLAHDFQGADDGGLSIGELARIGDWFERMGRRYGLLTEFRENAIC